MNGATAVPYFTKPVFHSAAWPGRSV